MIKRHDTNPVIVISKSKSAEKVKRDATGSTGGYASRRVAKIMEVSWL